MAVLRAEPAWCGLVASDPVFLAWLAKPGRRLAYSVGFTMTDDVQDAITKVPPGREPGL